MNNNHQETKLEFSHWLIFSTLFLALMFSLATIAVAQTETSPTDQIETPQEVEQPIAAGPICRYGVASFNTADNPYIDQLDAGWMVDFKVNLSRSVPSGVEYVPIIRIGQQRDSQTGVRLDNYYLKEPASFTALGTIVDANPGKLWLVGNEVDRYYWQDDVMPQVYAKAYHDIYAFIKQRDPSAQIAISGLVEVTPGRLQYLDIVWDTYLDLYDTPMPVDVWNMHVYILPEIKDNGQGSNAAVALGTDPALAKLESIKTDGSGYYDCALDNVYCYAEHDDMTIFAKQVTDMRQWMKDKGLQNKPLILSEFSLLYSYDGGPDGACFLMDENSKCFNPTRVNQFMTNAFNYLENAADPNLGYPADNNRLVQQWLWFAINDSAPETPNKLVEYVNGNPTSFTSMGTNFKNYVAGKASTVNLYPTSATYTAVFINSAPISVNVTNNGNSLNNGSYTVTFYSDGGLQNPIGSVVINTPMNGCARHTQTATITWNGLVPGVNPYWAKVDSGNAVGESNETNNVIAGIVLMNPEQIFLPTIKR
ncbi:MAG TPA: hypothetical protein EYP90_13910 [Chromatiaceae bacterium]|nr:hypothetical protein [Chromatiaceae bacterium]